MVAAQFGGADAGGGREFLQRVEQGFDGGGLGGIGDGFGEPPRAVRAVGANFQRAGRNHLNAGDGGRTQFRQNAGRFRGGGPQKMLKNKNQREQRRGDREPDSGGFRIHYFLRASQTRQPNNNTAPGNAPSNSQRTSRC